MKRSLVTLGCLALILGTVTAQRQREETPVQTTTGAMKIKARTTKPVVEFNGEEGHFSKATYIVITNKEKMMTAWNQLQGQEPNTFGPNIPPKIDFDHYWAVVVGAGPGMNSNGITFPIVGMQEESVIVRFDHRSYQTEGPNGGGVPCNAWGIAVLPKELLGKSVIFEQNTQNLIGQPPIWKKVSEVPWPQ